MDAPASAAGNPASRQKSCNACVKSKRRCDKRQPICSRCAEKKYQCVYQLRTGSSSYQSILSLDPAEMLEPSSSHPSPGGPAGQPPFSTPSPALDFSFLDLLPPPSAAEPGPPAIAAGLPVAGHALDPYLSFMGPDAPAVGSDLGLGAPAGSIHPSPVVNPLEDMLGNGAFKDMDHADNYESWRYFSSRAKINHIAHLILAFPARFARENETPFMHRQLYKEYTPRSILQCFMRSLQQNLTELLQESSVSPLQAMPRDKLARVHALFLYQIIRLFDGDEDLCSQAENDMPLLRTWLSDLCEVRDRLGDEDSDAGNEEEAQRRKDWERWVFAESVRRTIVMAYSFISLYSIIRGPVKDVGFSAPFGSHHRWTLSRHLWDAQSAFDFYCMWREKPHFTIENFALDDFLKYGSGDDMDEFARIMVTVYLGADQAREFYSRTRLAY